MGKPCLAPKSNGACFSNAESWPGYRQSLGQIQVIPNSTPPTAPSSLLLPCCSSPSKMHLHSSAENIEASRDGPPFSLPKPQAVILHGGDTILMTKHNREYILNQPEFLLYPSSRKCAVFQTSCTSCSLHSWPLRKILSQKVCSSTRNAFLASQRCACSQSWEHNLPDSSCPEKGAGKRQWVMRLAPTEGDSCLEYQHIFSVSLIAIVCAFIKFSVCFLSYGTRWLPCITHWIIARLEVFVMCSSKHMRWTRLNSVTVSIWRVLPMDGTTAGIYIYIRSGDWSILSSCRLSGKWLPYLQHR